MIMDEKVSLLLKCLPCLTVKQPYASMLVAGDKRNEYRNWILPSDYQGEWILIHAGATPLEKIILCDPEKYNKHLSDANENNLYSAIVGAVKFSLCLSNTVGPFKYEWHVSDWFQFEEPIRGIKGCQQLWFYHEERNLIKH